MAENTNSIAPVGATRIYFQVPGDYGYGPEFNTYAEAESHAATLIREFEGCPGLFTRSFVDVRIYHPHAGGGSVDKILHRVEIKRAV